MALPAYREVDLALLLELIRLGKPARPAELYERVSAHFPLLTSDDKAAVRKDGRTRVWLNMIHWARDHLRVQGVLADVGAGHWAAKTSGRSVLSGWLHKRGLRTPEQFIDSTQTLGDVLGQQWARPLRARPKDIRPQRPAPHETPTVEPPSAAEIAPRPTLADIQHSELEAARAELLDRLAAMDEYDFENFVGRVLDALGFRNTEVVGRPGDGGVDVLAVVANELVSATVAVQVKRQQSNVGPKEISYLRDRWGRRVDKLLFVTTSDFTAGAREVAAEHDTKPVQLVSGNELADTMIEHRIGVVAHTVERLELDDEFFGA